MVTGLRRYEFSERLADILRLSRRDLRVRVTLMISGGLVPPGPRGPGAPPATAEYAAELLIGVLAAPQQAHTVDAIRCYRALAPTAIAGEATAPAVVIGPPPAHDGGLPADQPPLLADRPRFGEALARLLAHARDAESRDGLARQLFGIWVSRGFPMAAVQFARWRAGRRAILSQRYEPVAGERPPAWLDPDRGGSADPGVLHSVFLPAAKLIEIGALTAPDDERKTPMLDIGPAIASIANLADLVRQRRHRRPWQQFLSKAAVAERLAETIDARPSRLTEVAEFGANPGNLRMLCYLPADLPPAAPLVVVLHGCTQTAASYDAGTGWSTLADRYGFALLLPEQRRTNNPLRCFNWFKATDWARDDGEALSIRAMIERMLIDHGLDRGRVFVTGLSAGGAMTSVMLATYPDVFAGGAIVAGVPYRCAEGLQEAFDVIFQGRELPAAEWGARVRAASPHRGPWPKVSVWHGEVDATVTPLNAAEIIKQWTDVHGLAPTPTIETSVDGHPYRLWRGPGGEDLIEAYTISGMAHGQPIDARGPDGCGAAQPFIHDIGISSAFHIARFWGLTGQRREVVAAERPPVAVVRTQAAPAEDGPSIPTPPTTAAEPARKDTAEGGETTRGTAATPDASAPAAPVDLAAIVSQALRAAGLGANARRDGDAEASPPPAAPLGIDIPGILATSFQAAGLLKGGEASRGGPRGGAGGGGATRGIDIQSILVKSFEAAGLLRGGQRPPAGPAGEAEGLAGTGWQGDGWSRLEDAADAPGDGPTLFGHASSGLGCDVGTKVRTLTRTAHLGARPRLSYRRKLALSAAINMLTTARFAVLVDGEVVDEVNAIGMDYAETAWTTRTDIDLARFAGRTVTLACEVAANSNICLEVAAKAWVRDWRIDDAAAPSAADHAAGGGRHGS